MPVPMIAPMPRSVRSNAVSVRLRCFALLDVVDELLDRLGLQQVRVQSSSCGFVGCGLTAGTGGLYIAGPARAGIDSSAWASPPPTPEAWAAQLAFLRRMDGSRRVALAFRLTHLAREASRAGIRGRAAGVLPPAARRRDHPERLARPGARRAVSVEEEAVSRLVRRLEALGIPIATPEDTILSKLEWARKAGARKGSSPTPSGFSRSVASGSTGPTSRSGRRRSASSSTSGRSCPPGLAGPVAPGRARPRRSPPRATGCERSPIHSGETSGG